MIIGTFVRAYKSYRSTKFIPINKPGKLVSIYIGPNGSGKSGILDALDKAFNGGDWCINSMAKNSGTNSDEKAPFVCPVFAVNVKEIKGNAKHQAIILDALVRKSIKDLNNFSSDAMREFSSYVDSMEFALSDMLLLPIGRREGEEKRCYLGPFERLKEIRAGLELGSDDSASSKLNDLDKFIYKSYKYFYIPVEIDAGTFTRLSQQKIQQLLDESLAGQVAKAIGNDSINKINEELEAYLNDLNEKLDTYKYHGGQRKLSVIDISEKVFDHFFSAKTLHKINGSTTTPISDLSSGEKRQALIESISSFLKRKKDRRNKVIIAIDEPDASLHASSCHDQFEKVASLSKAVTPDAQILVATHWYGFLPLSTNGEAHHIIKTDEATEITTIDLSSYRESIKEKTKKAKGKFPADAALKGYNDLVQSIFSSVASPTPYNWIICEGYSDKLYIEHLMASSGIERLRVLAVGGINDVMKIHDRLCIPMSDPEYKTTLKGKVICIIDTDSEMPEFAIKSGKNNLHFKRLALDDSDRKITIIDAWSNKSRAPVCIEDGLNSAFFCSALLDLSRAAMENSQLAEQLINLTPLADSTCSYDAFDYKMSDKDKVKKMFSTGEFKVDFAKRYCGVSTMNFADLPWAREIYELIKDQHPAAK